MGNSQSSRRVFLTPGAASEAPRSGPWRRFCGCAGSMSSAGSIICVPFCAFLMKKRSRNHFRPPQDDAKRKLTQVQPLDQFCKVKAHPSTASGSVLEVLLELLGSSQRVFLTPGAGSEALRSGPWRRFRGSTGSAISGICVPFCAFLMKKRDRNHFRPPQDDPKRDFTQVQPLDQS